MAKQKGIIKLVGKMGGVVYYYNRLHGYLARKVTSVNAARIRIDPAFARVRENNTEFAYSSWAVKLLRAAFRPLFANVADTRMTSRLTRAVYAMVKADTTNKPGQRRPEHGDLGLLRGFEFNKGASLESVLKVPYTTAIDRKNGVCSITIPTFQAKKMIKAPKGATHFRFIGGVAEVDFRSGKFSMQRVSTQEMRVRDVNAMDVTLVNNLAAGNAGDILLALGVEFLQLVNGEYCLLNESGCNVLGLVAVEKGELDKRRARSRRVGRDCKGSGSKSGDLNQLESILTGVAYTLDQKTLPAKIKMTMDEDINFDLLFQARLRLQAEYPEKSEKYMDNLSFRRLEAVKSKELKKLTEIDLITIGFQKVNHAEFKTLYAYPDLNGEKIYITRHGDRFELRGYRLRKEKDIHTTAELIDETLTKWRLKLDDRECS